MELNENIEDLAHRYEHVVITYDNIVELQIFDLFKFIQRNTEFNKLLDLSQFKDCADDYIQVSLLERKEKNLLKWLYKDQDNIPDDIDNLYNDMLDRFSNNYANITDFITGFKKFLDSEFVRTLTIILDKNRNNSKRIEMLNTIFFEYDRYKVEEVEDYYEYLKQNMSYTLCVSDELNVLDKIINNGYGKNKTFMIPTVGYNFNKTEFGLVVKGELETKIYEKGAMFATAEIKKFSFQNFGEG